MKRTIVTVTLAVVGLMTAGSTFALQRSKSPVPVHGQLQAQSQAQRQALAVRPMYQRGDTWYEFLLRQFNPTNFDYGAWIDNRRTLWITAEMMADLYNHDLYSRDVAEKATRKYNDHIERCNRAIEAGQHELAEQSADSDHALCNEKLTRVTAERDEYLRQLNQIQTTLKTKEQTVAELSLRVDGISMKSAGNGAVGPSVELSTSDPNVVRHINNLQEQIYAERETNKRLKGA